MSQQIHALAALMAITSFTSLKAPAQTQATQAPVPSEFMKNVTQVAPTTQMKIDRIAAIYKGIAPELNPFTNSNLDKVQDSVKFNARVLAIIGEEREGIVEINTILNNLSNSNDGTLTKDVKNYRGLVSFLAHIGKITDTEEKHLLDTTDKKLVEATVVQGIKVCKAYIAIEEKRQAEVLKAIGHQEVEPVKDRLKEVQKLSLGLLEVIKTHGNLNCEIMKEGVTNDTNPAHIAEAVNHFLYNEAFHNDGTVVKGGAMAYLSGRARYQRERESYFAQLGDYRSARQFGTEAASTEAAREIADKSIGAISAKAYKK